jgi:hypothetical protein
MDGHEGRRDYEVAAVHIQQRKENTKTPHNHKLIGKQITKYFVSTVTRNLGQMPTQMKDFRGSIDGGLLTIWRIKDYGSWKIILKETSQKQTARI